MKKVKMNKAVISMVGFLMLATSASVWSQSDSHREHGGMEQMDHQSMDTDEMNMKDMTMQKEAGHVMPANGMSMDHGRVQGGPAPVDARDPHAYSGGFEFGSLPRLRLADEHKFGLLLIDRLEAVQNEDNTWSGFDLQGWYGRDYNRLVVKAEGEVDNGELEESSTELLWGHAIASFWDAQLGLRYDSSEGPNRSWLAFGMQGLAPYWFEVDATAYIGDNGRTALGVEAEYELLLTQEVVLQPRLEATIYGKDDAERGLGSGLSDMTVGLRLRYEIRREFAPYVGVEWAGLFGDTADYARAAGQTDNDSRVLAGLRIWF